MVPSSKQPQQGIKDHLTEDWKNENVSAHPHHLHHHETCLCEFGKIGKEKKAAANKKRKDFYKTERGQEYNDWSGILWYISYLYHMYHMQHIVVHVWYIQLDLIYRIRSFHFQLFSSFIFSIILGFKSYLGGQRLKKSCYFA